LPVTGVAHGLPAVFVKAVFAHLAVAKEGACRTEKPVIVECLDDWHPQFPAGIIGCGRDERKRVVEMDYIWSAALEQPIQLTSGARGPDSSNAQSNIGTNVPSLNFVIVPKVFVNLIPLSEEKGLFRTDYRVFTSPLLVGVVSNNNLQGRLILCNLLESAVVQK